MTKEVKKVCLVTISLSKGGAERSTAILSKMLVDAEFDVHIVVLTNQIDYEYSGKLLNLGKLKSKQDSLFNRFKRFKILRSYLLEHQFDFIIDSRNRQFAVKELFYLYFIYKNFKIIYAVRSFKIEMYLPKINWIAKQMISKSTKIVGVSKAVSKRINEFYQTEKAVTIYNPVETLDVKEFNCSSKEKYIVFIGRLENRVKNINLLIEGYELSNLRNENIRLKIIGTGSDKEHIVDKIKALEIVDYVDFIPFTPHITDYLKNALYLVLTSHYEGFPRVLIESLSVGIPVISVDCQSGPNEIILNEVNGLLIENYNSQVLSNAMNRFVYDNDLYQKCKTNAKDSVKHLNQENIASQWIKILNYE